MYVAWTLMLLGTGLVPNSLWIIAPLPAVAAFIHFDIKREERFLEEKFGDEYLRYKKQVPRYF